MLRDAEGERGERQIRENRLYDIVKFTWLQLIRAAGCMCSRVHAYVRVVPIDRDRCRIETELCYICTFCGWDDSVSVLYSETVATSYIQRERVLARLVIGL